MTFAVLEKGEPMRGLTNNEEAVRVSHNLKDLMIKPIHQIYDLGYKRGYEDGIHACMETLTEQILGERKVDEHTE